MQTMFKYDDIQIIVFPRDRAEYFDIQMAFLWHDAGVINFLKVIWFSVKLFYVIQELTLD